MGGNANAHAFFESQPDYRPSMSFEEKYHSKAAGPSHDACAGLCDRNIRSVASGQDCHGGTRAAVERGHVVGAQLFARAHHRVSIVDRPLAIGILNISQISGFCQHIWQRHDSG